MFLKWKYLDLQAFSNHRFIAKFNQLIYSLLRFSEKQFCKKSSDIIHHVSLSLSAQIKEHLHQFLFFYPNLKYFSTNSPHYRGSHSWKLK